jgi:aminoglycoside 3-N-acetyltransferase
MTTSIKQLKHDFQSIGVRAEDSLMVHASLRSVGPVEGRAKGLVRALLSAIGEGGTLLAYVDFEATDDIPYFDSQKSPANSEHGVLAEVIRTWPGTVRSLNPGASMVAIGGRSNWFCKDHPMNYGYGPGTPLSRLVDVGGKILLLGSDFNHVTILHFAEHCAKLPNKRVIKRLDKALSEGAIIDIEIEEFDTSNPVVSSMPDDYFARITRQFVDAGYAQTGRVGLAPSVLLPAREFVSYAINMMEREFGI